MIYTKPNNFVLLQMAGAQKWKQLKPDASDIEKWSYSDRISNHNSESCTTMPLNQVGRNVFVNNHQCTAAWWVENIGNRENLLRDNT